MNDHFMMHHHTPFCSVLLVLALITPAMADQPSSEHKPVCYPLESPAVQDMIRIQRSHRKDDRKYEGYRTLFKDVTDTELLARLATAEVASAQCPELNETLLAAVIGTLFNRLGGNVNTAKPVVFRRDQFASSMNIYAHSAYPVFLCPSSRHGELYQKAFKTFRLMEKGAYKNPLPTASVNYYLHLHFGQYRPNPTQWAQWPVTLTLGRCATFYRRPAP